MKHLSNETIGRIKTGLLLACMLPVLRLILAGAFGELGADPVDTLTRSTGIWTLNLLFLTLAVTPLRRWTGWQWLARLRRIIALSCFLYACLHFLTYLVFDQYFDAGEIAVDITKRPFIAVGFIAFVLLIPLAITSTDGMIRRLGGRRWQRLHRLTYLVAIAGVFHYLWLVKRDITGPAWYVLALCLLLSIRMLKPAPPKSVAQTKTSLASAPKIQGR